MLWDSPQIHQLLTDVSRGGVTPDEALRRMRSGVDEASPFATVDYHRAVRQGFPEVAFCAGKTPAQAGDIVAKLAARHAVVLATRAEPSHYAEIAARVAAAQYDSLARTVTVDQREVKTFLRGVLVVCAGTSDLPVAREACNTLRAMGHEPLERCDVGVAGLHRILACSDALRNANVVIVIAGMEGALPSVVGGLTGSPVIAVPTSVGYGASFGGLAALLGMLNSCSAGIAVMNIDNGFGAGHLAARINARMPEPPALAQ
jgi:NCAIR mutase (PurE)-related protein